MQTERTQDLAPQSVLDNDISTMLNDHGTEIRSIADRLDAGDDELSEIADDVAADIKGDIAVRAANQVEDGEAEIAIHVTEQWVTDNISNSTSDRRIAAVYAFLGMAEARNRLGFVPEATEIKTQA